MTVELDSLQSKLKTLTVVKTLGDKEQFDQTKLEKAIHKAIGYGPEKKLVVAEIVKHVMSKIDTQATEVTTGYINALVEGYMLKRSTKSKLYEKYLNKYVSNKLKKQNELREKVSHMQDIMSFSQMNVLKKFSANQTKIAAERYLLRDLDSGEVVESISDWFTRVSKAVVIGSIIHDPEIFSIEPINDVNPLSPEIDDYNLKNLTPEQVATIIFTHTRARAHMRYGCADTIKLIDEKLAKKYEKLQKAYYDLMLDGFFEPNTPTLMNMGTGVDAGSACFTIGIQDNMPSIGRAWTSSSMIFKKAGGFGTNISYIRPAGSAVGTTYNAATGGIDLVLEIIDTITEKVKAGGKRRGANMGIMEYWHPQIMEFINYKLNPDKLNNFNVSVMFDADFWTKYYQNENIDLKFGGKIYDRINAINLIDQIALNAWKSAEPGILFKDRMNEFNPLYAIKGEINITNPCSEQAMYPDESCTLGSINLSKFVNKKGKFDWQWYQEIVVLSTRFLNDVLEINHYPTEDIDKQSNKTRRIGLGVMGLADALFKMGRKYNSKSGHKFMAKASNELYNQSVRESIQLAAERGPCEAYTEFVAAGHKPFEVVARIEGTYDFTDTELEKYGVRNMWTTTIAPTGTISMIADCSSSIEPIFALVFKKTVGAGDFYYLNEVFRDKLIEEGLYDDDLIKRIEANNGSVQGMEDIPCHIRDIFLTAMDMHWTDHVVAQSIWQCNGIDNAVSKTINMPFNATANDIRLAYVLAHELFLKGITIYRDGSRNEQVLHTNTSVKSEEGKIGVKAIVNEKVVKSSKPSFATTEYIKSFGINQLFLDEFTNEILNDKSEQIYYKPNRECPECHKGVMVNISGCDSCNLCGFSDKCKIG